MSHLLQRLSLVTGIAVSLIACSALQSQKNAYDLYELRPTGGPVYNDSYYTPPVTYKGCATINESPSCGGV